MVEYKDIHQKISSLSEFNPEQRKLKRNFFRSVAHVEMDNAGRILFPRTMLAHSGIEKVAIVIGMGNYIEIWNPVVFEKHSLTDDVEYSSLAEKYLDTNE